MHAFDVIRAGFIWKDAIADHLGRGLTVAVQFGSVGAPPQEEVHRLRRARCAALFTLTVQGRLTFTSDVVVPQRPDGRRAAGARPLPRARGNRQHIRVEWGELTSVRPPLCGDAGPGFGKSGDGARPVLPRGVVQGGAAGVYAGGVQVHAVPGELFGHLDLAKAGSEVLRAFFMKLSLRRVAYAPAVGRAPVAPRLPTSAAM